MSEPGSMGGSGRAPEHSPSLLRRIERRVGSFDQFLGPQLVVAAAILLDIGLPNRLTPGESWLLPSIEGALLLVLVVISPHPRIRNTPLRRHIAIGLIGLVSAVNIFSLVELIYHLVHGGKANGKPLILAGVLLWVTNVLLFGLWYWELDRGGPLARAQGPQAPADFMFPQTLNPELGPPGWRPGLLDYLYVSFTNATAFSPTDTMPLTQQAKVLMAAQSLASLLILGLVVARAVNILS